MTTLLENCACGNCRSKGSARGKQVSVDQAIAAVNAATAVCEKLEEFKSAENARPAGREVVREFMAVNRDGTSAGVVTKTVRETTKPTRQFAAPRPYFAEQDAPTSPSEDDLARAKARLKDLDALIDDPATDVARRISAKIERSQVLVIIETIEAALKTSARIGAAPTAGAQQYAPTVPYWNEPRVSDSKKAELEAEAEGIRASLRNPDLSPAWKIRLEQSLLHIERILGKTGGGDAVDRMHR